MRRGLILMVLLFGVIGLVPAQDLLIPGKAEDAGLTRIVPDTIIFKWDINALGNWEPFASVIGNDVFVVESNRFAEGTADKQNYGVALQPVAGGPNAEHAGFYSDDGQPYNFDINLSRQNGNPGRVAGDTRPGGANYIVGGEASPHGYDEFNSNDRWNDGVDRGPDGRYGAVQVFSLDKTTLTPTPLSLAIDPIWGLGNASGDAFGGAGGAEISRFGGEVVCLDNGNFVVVTDDKSNLLAGARAASAVVISPQGQVVVRSFPIAEGQIWSNVTTFKGGFCARVNGILNFFDNNGNLTGTAPQDTGVVSDTGRGDGTRLASHINSNYVFLAGSDGLGAAGGGAVRIIAYDARTFEIAADTSVSELSAAEGGTDPSYLLYNNGRVNVAVDALNRIAVSFILPADLLGTEQIACRVLAFNSSNNTFSYLTPTFTAFVNSGDASGYRSIGSAVAMTTRQILVAAKGEINSSNNTAAGPDTANEVNFYTVISHPDPQNDPTTPIGGTATTDWPLY